MPFDPKQIGSVTYVCNWNEGRSAHLELLTRAKLREKGMPIKVTSAGIHQGNQINPLRRMHLLRQGIAIEEIDAHKPTIFGPQHAKADLVLVAELPMKKELLERYPELEGRIMTVKGFVRGYSPRTEPEDEEGLKIDDAGGHSDEEKLEMYRELDSLADKIVERLAGGSVDV